MWVKNPIINAKLKHLKQLNPAEINLSGTLITDSNLVHLKSLTKLKRLVLYQTAVTDAGLAHLKGSKLVALDLRDNAITDASLEHLKGLAGLQHLRIYESKITDDGLEHFKGLVQLRQLDLRGTKATKSGVAKLQTALPDCEIIQTDSEIIQYE